MKHTWLFFTVAMLAVSTGCSNEGAYSEEEKKQQDSSDDKRQEAGFDKLLEDTGSKPAEAGKPGAGKNVEIKPEQMPGGAPEKFVPPQNPPPSGGPAPEPIPQTPKR